MEEIIRRHQKRMNKLLRKYFLTISSVKRARLAGEIQETEQALRMLKNMKSETPEDFGLPYETR